MTQLWTLCGDIIDIHALIERLKALESSLSSLARRSPPLPVDAYPAPPSKVTLTDKSCCVGIDDCLDRVLEWGWG